MPVTLEPAGSPAASGIRRWLWETRNSSRLAYVLHLGSRALMSLTSLLWTRWLLRAMGDSLNGLFLIFQGVAQLGGLGDLGMGGAVNIQAGQFLGQGKQKELQAFLAAARTVFLLLALIVGGGFLLLAPWLGRWRGLVEVPGTGSLPLLFAVGSVSVGALMLSSYVNNLNYACGTLTWPVIPAFAILQCCLFAHWLLARAGKPLWMQYIPYSVTAVISLLLGWLYLRAAFPALAKILPLKFDFSIATALLEKSFWLYLCSLGNLVYIAADRLIIGAWFGTQQVPRYHNNYKVCELAVFVILTAGFVSLPKITQWLADPLSDARPRVIANIQRLNQFQTLAGCAAALGYLAINDFFMTHWLGAHMRGPIWWQAAFALNLAITTSGDAGIQVATRLGHAGIRVAGGTIGLTALLNVGLSVLSANLGYVAGIAFATCIAQSILSVTLGVYVCRYLKIGSIGWVMRSWLAPVVCVSAAIALKRWLPFDSGKNIFLLAAGYMALTFLMAWVLGVKPDLLRDELKLVRSFFRGKAG